MKRKTKNRSAVPGLILFALVTLVILTVAKKLDPDIFSVLRSLTVPMVVLLLLYHCLYDIMEALVSRIILSSTGKRFPFLHMLGVTYVGIFAAVATPFGGKIPMQSLYLYHRGLKAGSGLGLMSIQYLMHKTAVVLLAAVFLITDWKWIHAWLPDIAPYLVFAFIICAAVILEKLLVYSWEKMKMLVQYLIGKLPDRGKWIGRKQSWLDNIDILYAQTHGLLRDRKKMLLILLVEVGKLLLLYLVPLICAVLLGLEQPGIYHMLGLGALMFMLSNALPNIAGMGSIEFSFLLIFSTFFGDMTLSVLLLYRLATYYMPFLQSCICFLFSYWRYRHMGPVTGPPASEGLG